MALPPGMDPSRIPLMPNPSGASPNFVDPPSLLDAQTGVGVALIVIGGVCVVVRLCTNWKQSRKLCLDDYLCVFAFAGGIAYWALSNIISRRGTSRHAWDAPISIMTDSMMQVQVAIQFVIAPTLWAAKASILALYIRVFGVHTWIRRTSYFWIAFMAVFYSMNIVIAGVYCIPRPGEGWVVGASFARCTSSAWLHIVVGVFSCLADLFILVLPFPILYNLHISMAKKLGLSVVFGTGIILTALSVVSLYIRVIIYQGNDPTWNGTALGMVTVGEIFGTIAVSCAPAISSFWLNILIKSTIWSELRSSFIFSSRRSNSVRQDRAASPHGDSILMIKSPIHEIVEDDASRKSSNHQLPLR